MDWIGFTSGYYLYCSVQTQSKDSSCTKNSHLVCKLLNNSCVLYCAAVSEKYEDQSQRNPYVTLSRLAPHFEDEIAGLQKRPFLAGFELFWTHFVCM